MQPRYFHRQRLRLQPMPRAGRARPFRLIARKIFAHPRIIGFAKAPFQIGDHALKGFFHLISAQPILVVECHHLIACAVQNGVAHAVRQFLPGGGHLHLEMRGQALQSLVVIGRRSAGPGHDGAILQRDIILRHDQLRVEKTFRAEPITGRAGAMR